MNHDRALETVRYVLDPDNRIIEVNDTWDAFAEANGAPEVCRQHVLGTPLLSHVCGDATKVFVVSTLQALAARWAGRAQLSLRFADLEKIHGNHDRIVRRVLDD